MLQDFLRSTGAVSESSVFGVLVGLKAPKSVESIPRNIILSEARFCFFQTFTSTGKQPPVLSACPLHTNSGCGKKRRISIGPW